MHDGLGRPLGWLVGALLLLIPVASVITVFVWARRSSKRGAPRVVLGVAYLLGTIAAVLVLVGSVGGGIRTLHAVGGENVEPSQKARLLAEGISTAMNCAALGFLLALFAAGWLLIAGARRQSDEGER